MFLWRNDDVTRQSRGVIYIYICLYICFPIYIYLYIHNLILCQNECQMSACGHALFVQHFMYTCICMHVCSFLLKRSMYDYKLYVSLLIFVYSLMDGDERASLQKKQSVQRTTTNKCLLKCCATNFIHDVCHISQ